MQIKNRKSVKLQACLVGIRNVGKSAFLRRIREDKFNENQLETMQKHFSKIFVRTPKFDFKIQIVDIPGNRIEENIIYLEENNLIFLMYDLTRKKESFKPILVYLENVSKNKNSDITVVLLGTKLDLIQRDTGEDQSQDHRKFEDNFENEKDNHSFFRNLEANLRLYKIDFHHEISSKEFSREDLEKILKKILQEQYVKNMLMDDKYFSLNEKGPRADSILSKTSLSTKYGLIATQKQSNCC